MDQIELEAANREILGKKVRLLRRQGITPVHLFGHGIESLALQCDTSELKRVLVKGAAWAVEQGYGSARDLEHTEDRGALPGVDPDAVSDRAYARGQDQVGTLGSGNHFLEIQLVDEVFDREAAEAYGLRPGQVTVMVHCGSRGFGYQVCEDYLAVMAAATARSGRASGSP